MRYFAFSTASLYPMEPEKAALAAFEAGYRDLEFFVNCEYNGTIDKARAQEIVDVCKDIDLIEHTDELFKLLY